MIELTLSLLPWAKYRKSKGDAKLHLGLDAEVYLPAFISLTLSKEDPYIDKLEVRYYTRPPI